jgi:dUTP pyrophosphatase
VIDRDYRGPIGVVLFNHSSSDFTGTNCTMFCMVIFIDFCEVEVGDRVAQLILEKYQECSEVVEVKHLPESVRGDGGFGSTGVNVLPKKRSVSERGSDQ